MLSNTTLLLFTSVYNQEDVCSVSPCAICQSVPLAALAASPETGYDHPLTRHWKQYLESLKRNYSLAQLSKKMKSLKEEAKDI